MKLGHLLCIGIALALIVGAIGCQQIGQLGHEMPVVASCEQQFEQQFTPGLNKSERADCYEDAAVARHDPALCESVGIGTWRQSDCIKAVIDAAPEDPSVYKKLRDRHLRGMFSYTKGNASPEGFNPSFGIEEYFLDIVEHKPDLSTEDSFICGEIESHYLRSKCYSLIAEVGQDASLCDKIPLLSRKDSCYWSVAREKLDSLLCDEVVDILQQSTCYLEVAAARGDPSVCDRVTILFERDQCYQHIAQVTHDNSTCDKVQDENEKKKCYIGAQSREG